MIDSDFDFPANFTFAVCRLPFSTRRIAITYVDNATTVYYASIYLCFLIVVHVSGWGEIFPFNIGSGHYKNSLEHQLSSHA